MHSKTTESNSSAFAANHPYEEDHSDFPGGNYGGGFQNHYPYEETGYRRTSGANDSIREVDEFQREYHVWTTGDECPRQRWKGPHTMNGYYNGTTRPRTRMEMGRRDSPDHYLFHDHDLAATGRKGRGKYRIIDEWRVDGARTDDWWAPARRMIPAYR